MVVEIQDVLLPEVHQKAGNQRLFYLLGIQEAASADLPDAQAHPVDGLAVVETEEEQSNKLPLFSF